MEIKDMSPRRRIYCRARYDWILRKQLTPPLSGRC